MNKYQFPLIIYDDQCTLCMRFRSALEKVNSNKDLSFVSIHEDSLYEDFPNLNRNATQKEFHLIDQELNIYSGSNAITFLVKHIPETEKFAWLIQTGMGQIATQFFYDTLAKYRQSVLSKCNECK